jgi:Uma2 family endonuclease
MAVQEKLMTVEEFWELYAGQLYELVQGRVIEMTPAGFSHGAVTRRIGSLLGAFVDAQGLGEVVGAETGFWLDPHTLRGADCAFIPTNKVQSLTEPEKYVPFAPDLAVEVVSPHDTASAIRDKVNQYRTAGTRLIWVIYPALRKVDVYLPDGTAQEVDADRMLDGGDVLPGLKIAVTDLFPTT